MGGADLQCVMCHVCHVWVWVCVRLGVICCSVGLAVIVYAYLKSTGRWDVLSHFGVDSPSLPRAEPSQSEAAQASSPTADGTYTQDVVAGLGGNEVELRPPETPNADAAAAAAEEGAAGPAAASQPQQAHGQQQPAH